MVKIAKQDALIKNTSKKELFHDTFAQLEAKTKQKIPSSFFDYIQSGASGEETLRKNTTSFHSYSFVPTFLNDVSDVDTSIQLFGKKYAHPFLLAPVGMLKLAHKDADLAVAKAAANFDIPLIQSTVSSYSLEEVTKAAPKSPKWFQLYWSNIEGISFNMVKRAEHLGYEAIVLTIDTVMLGWREKDLNNQFSPLKAGYGKANYINDAIFLKNIPNDEETTVIEHILHNIYHPNLSWDHVKRLKEQTKLPLLLKGILHPENAKQAIDHGVDGIIVSNHGGRQLDGVISTIDALPAIVEAVKGKIPILIDSGIRRGTDVVKAVALGAHAVLLGRPFVYGLAIDGQQGVENVLHHFIQETTISIALAGANNMQKVQNLHIVKS